MTAAVGIAEFETIHRGAGSALRLVDVREPWEFADGHVPGALSIPMSTLPHRLDELPAGDGPLYVICEVGGRSGQVVLWLDRQGIEAVNVDGGTGAWRASGFPLDT